MITSVIFDMDGVISDTQKLHARIESELLGKYGIKISAEEATEEYAGVADQEFFNQIFNKFGVEHDIDEVIREKWSMMKACKDSIEPLEGAIELIKYLAERGFTLAVASSSPHDFVNLVLSKLNVTQFFSAVVSQDRVQKTKPDPEIFLLSAQELGVKPSACLVIEDGLKGMIAAKKAGMKCVGYVRTDRRKERYPADFVVESLIQIRLDPEIQKLLG